MNAFLTHFWITLKLNARNPQALIFGYFVPVFFLVAFAAIYKTNPPLMRELGQVLTISIMGGACFGLPVALVSERERGVWRRYRLAPMWSGWLLISTLAARYVLVLSSAVFQILVAMLAYGMPLPHYPLQLLLVFTLGSFAFLGIGLVIGMLARTAQAVQAMGQMIFMPMIVLGGVAVPLTVLHETVRPVAWYLPGFYAARAMESCIIKPREAGGGGLEPVWFHLIALTVFGLAATFAGAKMFRWEPNQPLPKSSKWWVLAALIPWIAIGLVAQYGKFVPTR